MSVLHPTKLGGGPGREIVPGDPLSIWTHEDPAYGKGQGLTATAKAGLVTDRGETLDVVLRGAELVRPHVRLNDMPKRTSGSPLLDFLKGNRHRRTIDVSNEDVSQFWKAIGDTERQRQASSGSRF